MTKNVNILKTAVKSLKESEGKIPKAKKNSTAMPKPKC